MEERSEELWHEKARQLGIVVIIPTYNNEKTPLEYPHLMP